MNPPKLGRYIITTEEAVNSWTERALLRKEVLLSKLANIIADPRKTARLAVRCCPICYYLDSDRICGQAFTRTNCEECDAEIVWPNTDTPRWCDKCCDERQVCKDCGADLNLNIRPTTPAKKSRKKKT